jgi:serine/threonine protein kinase
VLEGEIPGLFEEDCNAQRALLPLVLDVNGGREHEREIAMDHGDIKPENIIVDDEYNITW